MIGAIRTAKAIKQGGITNPICLLGPVSALPKEVINIETVDFIYLMREYMPYTT